MLEESFEQRVRAVHEETHPRIRDSLIRDITIIVPAYNEARRIQDSLDQLLAYDARRFDRFEVLVVDDGSTDGMSEQIAGRFGERVRVIRQGERRGKGAAVRRGVMQTDTSWLLFADADLAIPIRELARLEAHADEAPIVIGSKRVPGSAVAYPRIRRALSGVGQTLISACVVSGFHDTQCGFKLFRTDVARELFGASRVDGFGFDFEVLFLARRLGHRVVEVPVACEHKAGSSVGIGSYLAVLCEIGAITWNRVLGRYPKR